MALPTQSTKLALPDNVRAMLHVYHYELPADWQQRETALYEAVEAYLTVDLSLKSALYERRQLMQEEPVCPVEIDHYIEALIYKHRCEIFAARLAPLDAKIGDLEYEINTCELNIVDLLPPGIWLRVGEYAVKVAGTLFASRPVIVVPWGKHHAVRNEQLWDEV